MIPTQPNPHPDESSIEALAAAWQALARQLRFLEMRGTVIPLEPAARLRALIQRSSESIRAIAAGEGETGLELQQPATSRGIAMRMLGGRAPALESLGAFEQSPGRGYTLLMSGAGSLLPAQEIVRLLAARKLRGVLKLRTASEVFTLEIERGEIAHLHTNLALEGERLGEVLVRQGVFGAQQMEGIRARNTRGRLGDSLLVGKHVTQRQLIAALEAQVHQRIGRLCQAQAENFAFWDGPLTQATPRLRIAVGELMLVTFEDGPGEPPASERAAG